MSDRHHEAEISASANTRWLGWAMLPAGILLTLLPDNLTPRPDLDLGQTGWTWIIGSIPLLSPGMPDRIGRLTLRQIGVGFLIFGLAVPFIINFINSALGD